MLVTAGVASAAAMVTTFVGCKDESQPEYWVDKLSELQLARPCRRAPAAVLRRRRHQGQQGHQGP